MALDPKKAANNLYGAQRQKDQEEKDLRNSLLDELGEKLTPAQILYSSVEQLRQIKNSINAFKTNYDDMKKANTKLADKYFHSKANCQAAQQGKVGAAAAKKISDIREEVDIPKNKYIKKYSTEEIITDYRDDQCANYYGRIQGAAHPNTDCKILVDKYRPRGLNKKY